MTRSDDIERLVRSGSRHRVPLLDVRHLDSTFGRARAAVIVAKFDRTAVARNKLKRRLRELVRRRVLPKLGSVDVLIRAKRDAYEASFAQLASAVDAIVGNLTPKS